MIKECKVLLQNEAVTVVRFDDIEVQLPTRNNKSKTVFVKCEDGKYTIVEGNIPTEKKINKKTTKSNAKDQKEDENIDA